MNFTFNTLLDNTDNLKMVNALREHIADQDCNVIKIATGYWDLPGLCLVKNELKSFLEREGAQLYLLIGTDPWVRAEYLKEPMTGGFPEGYIKRDIHELAVKDEYVDAVKLLLDFCKEDDEESKFKVRIYHQDENNEKQFFHAKCYIFLTDKQKAYGIIGSSNFTQKGLEGNSELNYLETSPMTITYPANDHFKGHNAWFDEKWEISKPWNKIFLEEVLRPSKVGAAAIQEQQKEVTDTIDPLTPYEVYIKYLQLQFGDMVDANTSAVLKKYLPEGFSPLEYQLDAVKQCFSVMKRYGGFLLGDVVGLGKTVVGVLLIRYFLDNAESLGRPRKVLIITPPAIKSNWENTIKQFDLSGNNEIEPCVTFVTTGSIGNISIDDISDENEDGDEIDLNAGAYGLILIDESHGFRNSSTQKYQAVNDLIGFINPTPYIALLSATPQNNSPRDIYNQIRLFQREANNSNLPGIEGGRLDSFFNEMESKFMRARNMPQDTEEQRDEARKIIAEVSEEIRKRVLNELVVRRTRADIKKLYRDDAQLLKFPEVKGPHKLEYHMDDELQQLFYDTIIAICPPDDGTPPDPQKHIGFYRYAAITQFEDSNNTKLYEKRNLTVDGISSRLQRIMRILLVKRLESSIAAFKTTLENLSRYNEVMIDMLTNDCVYICPDVDVNKIHQECEGDFSLFKTRMDAVIQQKGGNNRSFVANDFNDEYLEQLKNDRRLIGKLLNRWRENTYDPKFERFKDAIQPELFDDAINNPSGRNSQRLVIFTEAIDTLRSISRFLKSKGYKVLDVTSQNRNELQEKIMVNFDANCPADEQRDDYNVIVTTEVLAEGINLHRSNVILNYDAPWNATRLMQRIGRVNRIGSTEDFVHVFNFFPSEEGNCQIRLIEKAYAKLQSFHEMFGEDNKVFSEREELCEHDLQKIVDGDESPFGPFISELKTFRDNSPARYAYITSIDPKEIGGTIQLAAKDSAIYIFSDNTKSYISVKVDINTEKTNIISSLATMESLKCDPTLAFEPVQLVDSRLVDMARKEYQRHVSHYLTQQDSSRRISEALAKISEIRRSAELSPESRKVLTKLEKLVRSNDAFIIKQILKFDHSAPTLFGIDNDIDALIDAAFANIASKARNRRGESYVALYEIK